MKKVYLILTLFVASLFFYSDRVYAATYTYELTDTDIAIINDDFLMFRDKLIKYVEDNNHLGYVIYFSKNSRKPYQAFLFNSDYIFQHNTIGAVHDSFVRFQYSNYTSVIFDYLDDKEIYVSRTSTDLLYHNFITTTEVLHGFLDSDLTLNSVLSGTYLIKYKDTNYYVNQLTPFPTLYQIYLDHNVPPEPVDKFLEDKEVMNNFYSVIFTKIGDLATNLANNYIFLLIFGIFILIFIFEIIRRRLL